MLAFLSLISVCGLSFLAKAEVPSDARVTVPSSIPFENASHSLPDHYLGVSVEFASVVDFAGEPGSINQYSNQCFSTIRKQAGRPLIFRIGGNTQDRSTYMPNQPEAIINNFPYEGADQPDNLTYGPSYFESLNQLVINDPTIFGLRLYQADVDDQAQIAVQAASNLKSLYEFSVGNEPDLYSSPGNFSDVSDLETTVKFFYGAITDALQGKGWNTSFAAGDTCCNENFFPKDQIEAGLVDTDGQYTVGQVGQHKYIQSACSAESASHINLKNLMSHTSTVSYVSSLIPQVKAVEGAGIAFAESETNTISCQGTTGTSDAFGAAIFTFDYALQLATKGAVYVAFHQGTNYRYALWQPIKLNETEPFTRPNFAAFLAVEEMLGSSGNAVRIAEIPVFSSSSDNNLLAAYVAYEGDNDPKRLALISTDIYNGTDSGDDVPITTFSITLPNGDGHGSITGKRLTSPGANKLNGSTWGGQDYQAGKCAPMGHLDIEEFDLNNSAISISLRASEAIVVFF